ncbi:MAG TPA: hypothetical protein VNM47_01100 [Terriglobia bacterium]|nr:hypothetical protein [Terriglobia bacterium]
MGDQIPQGNFGISPDDKVDAVELSEDFFRKCRGRKPTHDNGDLRVRFFDFSRGVDDVKRLEVPMQPKADHCRLMLSDNLSQIDFTVLMLLYTKVNDSGGIMASSKKISEAQQPDRGQIDERKSIERLTVVVKFRHMDKEQIHDGALQHRDYWPGLSGQFVAGSYPSILFIRTMDLDLPRKMSFIQFLLI